MVAAETAVSDPDAASGSATSSRSGQASETTWKARARQWAEWMLGAVLVIAPLFLGGAPRWAVLTLEVFGVALVAVVLLQPRSLPVSPREGLAIALLLGLPLLYLIPLPAGLVGLLPGHALYADALALMGEGSGVAPLSAVPRATESSWLFLWALVGVFLVARWLVPEALSRLLLVVLAVGLLQSLLGMAQFLLDLPPLDAGGLGAGSFERVRSAAGTFSSPGYLAGLLSMMFALALASAAHGLEQSSQRRTRRRRKVQNLGDWLQRYPAVPYVIIALVLLAAILLTRSRAGIALSMVAILLWTLVLARRSTNEERWFGMPRWLVILGAGGVLITALLPLFDRFSVAGALGEHHIAILTATFSGAAGFFPFGSGPGTYSDVFPLFQPLALGHLSIEHAQNAFLEWVFEMGVFGVALVVFGLTLALLQAPRVAAAGPWPRARYLQLGGGIGLLLAAAQALFDDNLQNPANLVYFAFLCGLYFRKPAIEAAPASRRARRRRTPDLELEPQESSASSRKAARLQVTDQIPNPFLDEAASDDSSVS